MNRRPGYNAPEEDSGVPLRIEVPGKQPVDISDDENGDDDKEDKKDEPAAPYTRPGKRVKTDYSDGRTMGIEDGVYKLPDSNLDETFV